MDGLNIELTTCCPLHCPQCYCTLEGGKHIPITLAKQRVLEASEHGVKIVHLSGGETLCYPDLIELVKYASSKCDVVNVAVSGWHFTQEVLNRLIEAKVSGIFISLNGSTEEINSKTRDGYDYAINALKLLKENHFAHTVINWVMHSYNAFDFENVLKLAEEYDVSTVVVLAFKPDSHNELKSFPNKEQILAISNYIKSYKGKVKIGVESCFSQLLAVLRDTKLFGNLNVGPTKGCRAGLYNYSVDVDGCYSPCRHLPKSEKWESLDEYLAKSPLIQEIRKIETRIEDPCLNCRYQKYCRPCLAINYKMNGRMFIGNKICELWSMD